MSRKKKHEDPPKGAPLWMTTYGDMITLVLCFFILLYSYSSLDVLKWKQVVSSVRGSLGVMDGGSTLDDSQLVGHGEPDGNPNEKKLTVEELIDFELLQQEKIEMENLKEELNQLLAEINQKIIVETDSRGVVIRFEDSVLFDKGKADLKPEAKITLNKLSKILITIKNPIRIEGHTDNLSINTIRFPSNWELSTSRSTNVLRYLIEANLNPQMLSAVGYGEYHPIVPNENEENRRKNRRVDIVILKDSLALQEPSHKGGAE